jgi:hypothetical protein
MTNSIHLSVPIAIGIAKTHANPDPPADGTATHIFVFITNDIDLET